MILVSSRPTDASPSDPVLRASPDWNLMLSITYNTDFQITKILIYKPDYSLITILTDFSICEKNNIYYNEELSQILECHELCKTCYNGNINNCNSCYDGKILNV